MQLKHYMFTDEKKNKISPIYCNENDPNRNIKPKYVPKRDVMSTDMPSRYILK